MQADLQQLQHGLSHIRVHPLLEQLIGHANRLPQVGVRLTQHVVQLHCLLRVLSPALCTAQP